jgi:hypothetical protein
MRSSDFQFRPWESHDHHADEFLKRYPSATVYICPLCGEHYVVQDDPAAHRAAMKALANYIIDEADRDALIRR